MTQLPVAGIEAHLDAFQAIADSLNDSRASGTAGYDASGAYVTATLEAADHEVTVQPFESPFFEELMPSTFARTAPTPRTYTGNDFLIMKYSGSGSVTDRAVQSIDLVLPPGASANTSTSGCASSDFSSCTAENMALVQRGTCSFAR